MSAFDSTDFFLIIRYLYEIVESKSKDKIK